MLIRPSPIVTGTISTNVRFTAGSRMSITTAAARPSRPRSHGSRQKELGNRRDEDRNRVDVELRRVRARALHAQPETEQDDQGFHSTGLRAGTVKWS